MIDLGCDLARGMNRPVPDHNPKAGPGYDRHKQCHYGRPPDGWPQHPISPAQNRIAAAADPLQAKGALLHCNRISFRLPFKHPGRIDMLTVLGFMVVIWGFPIVGSAMAAAPCLVSRGYRDFVRRQLVGGPSPV
jgi:hypothetical protein